MKFQLPLREFRSLIAAPCRLSRATRVPATSNLFLFAAEGRLYASGTDLERHTETSVPCDVEDGTVIGMPSRELATIIGSLPEGDLLFEQSADSPTAIMRCGRSKITLRILGENDYLPIASMENAEVECECNSAALARCLNIAEHACSEAATRYGATHAVRLKVAGDSLSCSGTDTHRFAWARQEANIITARADSSALIPVDAARELAKLLGDYAQCRLRFNANGLLAYIGPTVLSVVIEGGYPKVEKFFEIVWESGVEFAREDFASILRRAQIMGDTKKDGAKDFTKATFEFKGESLRITANGELGEVDEELSTSLMDDFKSHYNTRYVSEALDVLGGDNLKDSLHVACRCGLY